MNQLAPTKRTDQSISSLKNLSNALDIPLSELLEISTIIPEKRYRNFSIPKSGGGERIVYDPIPQVRKVQNRINKRIFKELIIWPPYLFGSIPNDKYQQNEVHREKVQRDYIACAKKHCGSKSILKLDIANFFENIHRELVSNIFREFFKYPDDVSDYLTEVCCYENRLVQGALTSSYLASLCLHDSEATLVKLLDRRNLVYTRLVDDITISSKYKGYDFSNAEAHVRKMLLEKDFPVNVSKTKIMRVGTSPLVVHGLIVDFNTPRLPPSEVSKIRASVHNLVKSASVNNYRTTFLFREQYYKCLGRVNLLARVGHNKHEILLEKLKKIRPRPRKTDIEKVENSLSILSNLHDKKSHKYRRLYNITKYRIEIISRSFFNESQKLLFQLRKLEKPI